ncbi:YwaF family protein [Fusibacter sp. JL298sf-3]
MFQLFWEPFNTGPQFYPFSFEHLLSVLLIGLAVYSLFAFKGFYRRHDCAVRWSIAVLMGTQQLFLYAWYITSGSFTLGDSLPLYTCRLAILLCIVMMLRPKQWLIDITYFWGMVGGIIALITPDTSTFTVPHFMFLQYFIGHGLLLFSIFYMLVIKQSRITMQSLLRTTKVSLAYVAVIIPINFLLDGNYSYLNGKPVTPTLLDALPAYPIYVPILVIIMLSLFALAYVPFYYKASKNPSYAKSTI